MAIMGLKGGLLGAPLSSVSTLRTGVIGHGQSIDAEPPQLYLPDEYPESGPGEEPCTDCQILAEIHARQ